MRISLIALTFALSSGAATAQPLIVAELFTSQSCSSCPPAEDYFRTLSTIPGVLTLEWHVDYWDGLRTADGVWKDPFSSPDNTARQRAYNRRLRRTTGVYTPQTVVDGAAETVGSDPARVATLIAAARRPADATLLVVGKSALRASLTGAHLDTELLLVRFRTLATTHVGAGENSGRMLASAHVVTLAQRLTPGAEFAPPSPGEGCAVLAQDSGAGPILAAAVCPS
ncbi:MAG: DUF1223 domain-containing protein [Parvularculaceae bacterium]|nr:DUF1223 domain-containing protein [Parvularculaceae bacterium]